MALDLQTNKDVLISKNGGVHSRSILRSVHLWMGQLKQGGHVCITTPFSQRCKKRQAKHEEKSHEWHRFLCYNARILRNQVSGSELKMAKASIWIDVEFIVDRSGLGWFLLPFRTDHMALGSKRKPNWGPQVLVYFSFYP